MKSHVKTLTAISLIFSITACSILTPNTIAPSPTQTEEIQNQISAGFTDNEAIPFIILHSKGEQLAVTQDVNSKGAVVGDDILLYSNYTEKTVDIIIFHPDGTSEVFTNLEIDTTLINKVKPKSTSSIH